MKKVFWIILGLIILIVGGLLIAEHRYEKRFESDYEMLEKEMLLVDSKNRGYSDLVENRINDLNTHSDVKNILKSQAKTYRKMVRSKNEDLYVENAKIFLQTSSCAQFKINLYKFDDREYLKKILSDTDDMHQYYRYLDLIRFASADSYQALTGFINDFSKRVNTQEDFERLCKN